MIKSLEDSIKNYYHQELNIPLSTEHKKIYDKVVSTAHQLIPTAFNKETNVELDEHAIDSTINLQVKASWVQTALNALGYSTTEAKIKYNEDAIEIAKFKLINKK